MCMVSGSSVRRKKNAVGIVAIALLLFFTVLAFAGYLSFIEWVVADVIVALIANLILRKIGK
jgi:ABC-type transporter Mla maintaining outer membrane lipid asymmetry permease subunit MlaE